MCVPAEDYGKVFEEQHENIRASHPGYYRTLRRIQEFYYWPKMSKIIRKLVKKCEVCRVTKASNVNVQTTIGSRRETDYPFKSTSCRFHWSVDNIKKKKQLFVCRRGHIFEVFVHKALEKCQFGEHN